MLNGILPADLFTEKLAEKATKDEINLNVMNACAKKKFTTDTESREALLGTEDKQIVYEKGGDNFWSISPGLVFNRKKVGENHWGKILMQVRKKIKEEERLKESREKTSRLAHQQRPVLTAVTK